MLLPYFYRVALTLEMVGKRAWPFAVLAAATAYTLTSTLAERVPAIQRHPAPAIELSPDLVRLKQAWPQLPEARRKQILLLAEIPTTEP